MHEFWIKISPYLEIIKNILKDPLFQGILAVLVIAYSVFKFIVQKMLKSRPHFFVTFSELKKLRTHEYSGLEFNWLPTREYRENGESTTIQPLIELKAMLRKHLSNYIIISGGGGMGKSRLVWEFARKHKQKTIFFRWADESAKSKEVVQAMKKLSRKVKYIILDDVHDDPGRAVSLCISCSQKNKTFILLTRYPDILKETFARAHIENLPHLNLKPMRNIAKLTTNVEIDAYIKQRCAEISAGNPEIYRLAYRLAKRKSSDVKESDLTKLFQGITRPEGLFQTIKQDISQQTANDKAVEICARVGLLRGVAKSDPCCETFFDFFTKLKTLGYVTVEQDIFYIKPDILGDFLALNFYFPESMRSPEFDKLIHETEPESWDSVIASLAVFNKEADEHDENLFRDAAGFVLESANTKDSSKITIAKLAVSTYNQFNDFALVYDTLGDFWKSKIKSDDLTFLNEIGIFCYRTGNFEFAQFYWEQLLKSAQQQKSDSWTASTYGNLGLVYQAKGQWDRAIEFYQKAQQSLEKIGDEHGMAQTYTNLGNVYQLKGEWDRAIDFYQKALQSLEKIGDQHGMAQTYGNLGVVYQAKGEWDRAIDFYQKSIDIKEKIGDEHGMAQTFNNLGLVYQAKGQWDRAIDFSQKAQQSLEKIGDQHGMAQTYGNLGVVYQAKGEWDRAIDFYQKSLDIKEKIGDQHGMAQTFNNLGLVYKAKGEWDRAIEFYQKAQHSFEKIGDEHGMAQTFNNLGLVYQAKGQWDRAVDFYQKSLDIKEKIGDEHGMAQTYGNLSLLYFEQKKYTEAIRLMHEILFLFAKLGAGALVQQAGGILGDFQKELGKKEFSKIADPIVEHIFQDGVRWGRHQVVSAHEAKGIWEQVNASE